MRRNIFTIAMLLLALMLEAQTFTLANLDDCLRNREHYTKVKEGRITLLSQQLRSAPAPSDSLHIIEDLYKEYATYQFDSAMVYTQMAVEVATRSSQHTALADANIQKIQLLATGGFYSEAEKLLTTIDVDQLTTPQKYNLGMARFWLYNYWAAFTDGSEFSSRYDEQKLAGATMAMQNCDRSTPMFQYLQAEICYMTHGNMEDAIKLYRQVLSKTAMETRLYAAAAYALARCYHDEKNDEQYREWLIRAAMSDQKTPLKENLALQELAMQLYQDNNGELERASRYINYSMDDANFFNNKLRMLEISQKLPVIVSAYQKHTNEQNRMLRIAFVASCLLLTSLLVSLVVVRRQNRKLHTRRNIIETKNAEMESMNKQLTETNQQLTLINTKMVNTARIRERYLRLFMDLSAMCLERINAYKRFVVRKIKANQANDLLKSVSYDKISDTELADFLQRFDHAFLELYPTFIDELNKLLKPEHQTALNESRHLSSELRILALIRLGVKESAEIATLLQYSPQTIYNYRSTIKNKAISKETFEADVAELCKVM